MSRHSTAPVSGSAPLAPPPGEVRRRDSRWPGVPNRWALLRELVRREFQSRYAGSVFGILWAVVQPLWLLVLFTFVFSVVLRMPVGAMQRPGAFALFLFAGLLPWTAIQEGLSRSTTAVSDAAALLKRARFPAHFLVLSPVLSALLHQLLATVLFVVVLLGLGRSLGWSLLWLGPALLVQAALTVGLGFGFATVQVFLRDFAQAVPMFLGGWFYLTPIVYSLDLVPERFRAFLEWNPLAAVVGWQRAALLGSPVPGVRAVVCSVVFSLLVLVLGGWLFHRARPQFVDEI